ncbi:unannotated protein [freshwater metagenome]|uniref:Unannotated protein n=1 Tax=freshwater metagenome TaxID=449393 RepID=A0A6J7D4H8_9ZZZZ|nr:hypothetical protein [Actinomycetota bacterium]
MKSQKKSDSKLSKNEFAPNFARDWVEFRNPDNSEEIFKCDITWLTSYWQCIYGNGCCGIDADKPDAGCCSDGAYYTNKMDEEQVLRSAKKLTKSEWQFYDQARDKSKKNLNISEIGLDKDRKTRKINDSCIFLNRVGYEAPGYTGKFGCALHHLASKEGSHPVDTKPDICWQLPLHRSWEVREVGDTEVTVVVIGEYERSNWGEGGADLDWYCTSNSEAHVGKIPVYQSSKTELIKMMGKAGYLELEKLCDSRMAAIAATKKAQKRRELPLFVIHPATRAVQEQR